MIEIPLRYKIVDRLNDALKVALGPAHRRLKVGIIACWRTVHLGLPRGGPHGGLRAETLPVESPPASAPVAGTFHMETSKNIIWIDSPTHDIIDRPYFELRGWYASVTTSDPVRLSIGHRTVPLTTFRRPDVEQVYLSSYCIGFWTFIQSWDYLSDGQTSVDLKFDCADGSLLTQRLTFTPEALRQASVWHRRREGKREWLLTRIVCPTCRVKPVLSGGVARCPRCSADYTASETPMRLIPADMPPMETDFEGQVCSHGYDGDIMKIIDDVKAAGGKILDCGAGLRPEVNETVITTEIFSNPSIDVLAVGQRLPFADDTFDAVLSLHVLEHVSNPFVVAQELLRVVKPGGLVYAVTPMIVPEHGFPHHYFNPTIEGLMYLFKGGAKIEKVQIPFLGHPMNGVRSVLSVYAHNLPESTRERFMRMSVEDLLAGTLEEKIVSEVGEALSEEGRRMLAANFSIWARKVA